MHYLRHTKQFTSVNLDRMNLDDYFQVSCAYFINDPELKHTSIPFGTDSDNSIRNSPSSS